jgi:hypothetical protein
MTATHRRLPRKVIFGLIVTWLVLFALGAFGHHRMGYGGRDAVFRALQLFHLHYHPHPEPVASAPVAAPSPAHGPASAAPVHWAIEVARFGCALWGLAILPVVVGFVFERPVRQWWVARCWRGHFVVSGNCSRTQALVADLSSKGKRVVWVGRCEGEEPPLPRRVLRVDGDPGDPAVLAKTAVNRAAQLVALHEDDRLNIETLVAAGRLCTNGPQRKAPLEAYAHVADPSLEHALRGMIESGKGFAGDAVHEHLFDYYELMARLLARRFPLPPTLADRPPAPEHIVIIGFAAFGQRVALRILLMSQQLYREPGPAGLRWGVAKPRLTVVDPAAEARLAEFAARHPALSQCCTLDHHAVATTDPQFCRLPCFAPGAASEHLTVIFCIETEAETMRILQFLADLATGARATPCAVERVFIRIAQPERMGPVLERLAQTGRPPEVVFFAPEAAVFNANVILNQSLDVLAGEIHQAWLSVEAADRRANNQPPAAGKTWAELAENDRESNREAADHLWAKLHVLGYTLAEVPEGVAVPAPDAALLREIESRKEELARAEHYRWMTWRILNNWKWGATRDNQQRLHPDILDYDQLADTTKDKDRVNISVIPKLLKEGRLQATRRPGSQSESGNSPDTRPSEANRETSQPTAAAAMIF